MTSGIPGSTYQPYEDTVIRLARWRQLANTSMPVDDIAREIGMSRHALEQMVSRARKRGNPDAILHPNAGTRGLTHLYRSDARRARRAQQGAST